MNLIVGNVDQKMHKFLRQMKFTNHTIIINKMCNVKYLTEPIDLYIPFNKILSIGIVENTLVHLDELVLSTNVKKIIYGNINNQEIMNRIKKTYNVLVEFRNFE